MGESIVPQHIVTEKSGLIGRPFNIVDLLSHSPGYLPIIPNLQVNNLFIANGTPSRNIKYTAFDNLFATAFNATTRFVLDSLR